MREGVTHGRFAVVAQSVFLVGASLPFFMVLAGCGGQVAPEGATDELNRVVITTVSVPGSMPPANPATQTATPSNLNRAYALEYRLPGVADDAVDKVLILMPGFQGGAGTFDYMARRIPIRSGGRTVVFAVDRRSNALEDQTGLDAAEAQRNPDVAKDYYFRGMAIDGKTFAGFLDAQHSDISYMSEWGMKTCVEDLDAIVTETQRRFPQAAIFLGGHSLGATIVTTYAAWDFGGRAGFERLSGLLLFEGTPSPEAPGVIPDRDAYETTGEPGGLLPVSLQSIRTGDPLSSIPFIGTDVFVSAQIGGMRASKLFGQPQALTPDTDLIHGLFALLFGLDPIPKMTNRAVIGFGFDHDFEPLAFARVSIGVPVGPVGHNPRASLFAGLGVDPAELKAPISKTATYDWIPSEEAAVPQATHLETFARALFEGPSDFIEWYFPARLTLDAGITSSLNVQPSGDWRNEVYDLRVTENARVDVPVFAVAGERGLVVDPARFLPYRDSISPVLRDGTERNAVSAGFTAFSRPGFAHVDVLTADDSGAGNGEFGPMVNWMNDAVKLAPRQP
jgi:pimeloyl-ACP methyl ester carboxylesterase